MTITVTLLGICIAGSALASTLAFTRVDRDMKRMRDIVYRLALDAGMVDEKTGKIKM